MLSLLDRLAPWPLVVIAGLAAARSSPGTPGPRTLLLLFLWVLVPLVLFSLARTHHHWYLDPTYPA